MLRYYNLRAKKGLGQHFLGDKRVLRKIISAADPSPNDLIVEVGAGLGILAAELAELARQVIAIEIDNRLTPILNQNLGHFTNITIISGDVLQLDPAELIGDCTYYKVVANLPYSIAAPVLRHFLESPAKPCRMVVMVQKEVAQSIAAPAGKMSLLGVATQFYGKPTIVSYVPARSFYPLPKVDSAILSIDVYEHPAVEVADVDGFFKVVRAGFCAPRKQLKNSLAQGLLLSSESATQILNQAGVSPSRRAQTLTVAEWAKVYYVAEEQNADPSRLC